MMDQIWNELYGAAMNVIHPREVSRMVEAGGVAAAVESALILPVRWVCVRNAMPYST